MKTTATILASLTASFALFTASAQPPGAGGGMGGPPGPRFDGYMSKIFEKNSAFSATMELHSTGGQSPDGITIPGKFEFLDGKSYFKMDMTSMQGAAMPPQAIAQMKKMGMDKMASVSRPDLKVIYIIYPGMHAYVENPSPDNQATAAPSDYKMEITKLGDDTVDGHACTKKKVTVTDKNGATHDVTVWTANDLKDFPVRIETSEGGQTVTMTYKDIKLDKPNATDFEPPSDFRKASSMMDLMMGAMQH